MEERFRAMKTKVNQILSEREQMKLNTKETTDVIKNIRAKLSKSDLDEVKTLTDEAVKEKPADVKMALGPWKITQRLKVICRFVLGKFKVTEEEMGAESGENNVEMEDVGVINVTSDVVVDNDAINRTTNLPSSTEISNPTEPNHEGETSTPHQISDTGDVVQSTPQRSVSPEREPQNIPAAEQTLLESQSSTSQTSSSAELTAQQRKDAVQTPPVTQSVVTLSVPQSVETRSVTQSIPQTSNTDTTPKPSEGRVVVAETSSRSDPTTAGEGRIVVAETSSGSQPIKEPVTQTSTVTENREAAQSSTDNVATGPIPQSPRKAAIEKKIEYPLVAHQMVASKEGNEPSCLQFGN